MALKKGSTLPETELRFIDCAHAPHCTHSAVIRERLKTGWANLCWLHYMEHVERDRAARWISAGKPTREQSLAKMKDLHIKTVVSGREPGCDDEIQEPRQVSV